MRRSVSNPKNNTLLQPRTEGGDRQRSPEASPRCVPVFRYSKVTPEPCRVEGLSSGVRIALSLNEACEIVNDCGGRRLATIPTVGAVSIVPPATRYVVTITGVASALLFEVPWQQIAAWVTRETDFDPARLHLQSRTCVKDDALARALLGLASSMVSRREEALQLLLECIVRRHSNRAITVPASRASGGLTPLRLKQVTEVIEDRFGECLSLDDLVEVSGLSKFHFIRAFKATVGTTPHQHLLNRRLSRALEALLDRNADIGVVAARLGFSHASHMSALLKSRFGVSPNEFRRSVLPQTLLSNDWVDASRQSNARQGRA